MHQILVGDRTLVANNEGDTQTERDNTTIYIQNNNGYRQSGGNTSFRLNQKIREYNNDDLEILTLREKALRSKEPLDTNTLALPRKASPIKKRYESFKVPQLNQLTINKMNAQ